VISPINIYKDLNVDAAAGSGVTLAGQVRDSSGIGTLGLTKTGAGSLGSVNLRLFNVAIQAGSIQIIPGATNNSTDGASTVQNLTIAGTPAAPTAALDLTNNALVLDYAGGSPIADVRSLLRAGLTGSNGIRSSLASDSRRLGYGEGAAVVPGGGTFAGQNVDGNSVVIAFTVTGDANLDFVTNIGDFSRLAASFNTPGLWANGDFDYTGLVDIGDFSLLAANFNQTLGRGAPAAVPEPTGSAVLLLLCPMLARVRRRNTII
jgi:hypothetical protein